LALLHPLFSVSRVVRRDSWSKKLLAEMKQRFLVDLDYVGRSTWKARRIAAALQRGQEDQLGALGLVLNVTVLWNTIYIEAALEQLRQDAQPVRESGLKALNRVTSSSP
jgi:Tn3 transposase DDE domain